MLNSLKQKIPKNIYHRYKKLRSKILVNSGRSTVRLQNLDSPVYVVATPGNLPCVKYCLNFIPKTEHCVLVLNGLEEWEQQWAYDHLHRDGFVVFNKMVRHSYVIDYLIQRNSGVFGLLDFDCFVLDPQLFSRLKQIPHGSCFSSFFGWCNNLLGYVFPDTFLLYLDSPELRRLAKKYRADSSELIWDEMSQISKRALVYVGFNTNNLPENFKPFFDTLRLLMSLSLAEGQIFSYPDDVHKGSDIGKAIHVGYVGSVPLKGISYSTWYQSRGSYFWNRALEETKDKELQDRYMAKYGYTTSKKILERIPQDQQNLFGKNGFLETVDFIFHTN